HWLTARLLPDHGKNITRSTLQEYCLRCEKYAARGAVLDVKNALQERLL
ncbi:hypothetical protein HMPREF9069_00709, partial [Atopobium sp. oral taxon 810 str. F0209]